MNTHPHRERFPPRFPEGRRRAFRRSHRRRACPCVRAIRRSRAARPGCRRGATWTPNAFVRIGADNTVTVISKHLEMGQGSYTGLATLVADELDAAWSQVRVEGAPADATRYNNTLWGPMQGTGGSTAIANSWDQLRQAGAAARAMLVAAAAQRWNVPASSITVKDGVLLHAASKRKATFGELANAAAALPVPADAKPKDPKDWVYIGKHVPRKDARAKITGAATFTQDVKLQDMLTAVVAHAPRIGARHTGLRCGRVEDDSRHPPGRRDPDAASRCWPRTSGPRSKVAMR